MTERRFRVYAGLIILFSLGLNLAGNNAGLGMGVIAFPQHLDVAAVARGAELPHPFYGPLSYYVFALPTRIAAAARQSLGAGPADEMWLHRAARCVCALLGAICTLCVMLIAGRGLGRGATLLAGLLCAFSPGMVFMFHGESVNAVLSCCALAACAALAALATTQRERLRHWALVALFGGLSAAAKESSYGLMPGGLIGVFLARYAPLRPEFKRIAAFIGKSALVGLAALALYGTINLGLFFPGQLDRHLEHYVPADPGQRLSEAEVERRGLEPPQLYLSMVEENLGPSMLIWFSLGTVLLLRRRQGRPLGWLFLCVLLVHYLTFGMLLHWFTYPSRGLKPYDVLFVSALAAVPAAAALESIAQARQRVWRSVGRGLAGLVVLAVLVCGLGVDLALLHPSVDAPLRRLLALPGPYTLYEGLDVYVQRPGWADGQVISAEQSRAQYALLLKRDPEVEGLIQAGYTIEAEFPIPWQAALAPPAFRLQRELVLLKRPGGTGAQNLL